MNNTSQPADGIRCDLSALKLLRFRFMLRSHGIKWTRFKGFPFHGALGDALKTTDPLAYHGLYDAGGIGAPFVLTPPCDHQGNYPSGHKFLLEITLLGQAIPYMPACCDALCEVGRRGIDKSRGTFDVVEILSITPCGTVPVSLQDEHNPVNADEIAAPWRGASAQYVSLRFVTPVRIKKDNVFLRRTPSFRELMEALLARIRLFGGVIGRDEREKILAEAERVFPVSGDIEWVDRGFERYSASQRNTMKFGGLLGEIMFRGELAPFMPYLAQLEYLNLGGKTTFGLGKCLLRFEK